VPIDETLVQLDRVLTEKRYVAIGDTVGFWPNSLGTLNFMKLHRIGNILQLVSGLMGARFSPTRRETV